MDYYLAEFGSWVLIIEGVAFIVFVLVFRRGVVGEAAFLGAGVRRWREQRQAVNRNAKGYTA
jgi:branched-chain amino acid transport system permease protein